ncbi:site-specific integrase [Deinococcus sp. Leaf326]|uniref:tyrosine-type recombinase/integrase n=1 Tax=Deinococcus sp. Leaf326 TaxID=1736338 RepID=UPI0006FDF9D3|nr:site-specific integrase [Deinococcus sp. Leaf326]KQR27267.1 hypothetical protein ASF71_17750 [Deinococcus sp. Leaf326]
MGKRANGEGTIVRKANGKGWAGAITVGHDENGKQVRRYVSGSTQAEVREKIDALRVQREQGALVRTAHDSFGDFLDKWLAYKQPHIRQTTYADYEAHVRRFVKPLLGGNKLGKLTPMHVEGMVATMLHSDRPPAQVRRCLKITSMALAQALDWELVGRNAAERIKPPKVKRNEMRVWTPEQARAFLSAAEGHRYYALYYVALATGMRRGELLALRWADIDTVARTANVGRTAVYVGGKLRDSTPKTAAGNRVVSLGQDVLDILTTHRLSFGYGELIFGSRAGTYLNPSNVARAFERFCEQAGVPRIRFHDLRHTSASLLIRSNISVKVVSDRLGHADSSFTLRTYVHVFDDQRRAAALSLGQMLSEAGD